MYKDNIPSGYHISVGAEGVFYILNDGETYISKLSTDLKEAKAKAKNYVGSDVPVNIWYRDSWKTGWTIPQYHEQHILDHKDHLWNLELEAKKARYAKYSHIGTIGEKLNLELTITDIYSFSGEYGLCFVHRFKDNNDNQLIYFGNSKDLVEYRGDAKFQIGNKITVEATIKNHIQDKTDFFMPLTVITRPKINKPKKERANNV